MFLIMLRAMGEYVLKLGCGSAEVGAREWNCVQARRYDGDPSCLVEHGSVVSATGQIHCMHWRRWAAVASRGLVVVVHC
jgi:hypothetical protein